MAAKRHGQRAKDVCERYCFNEALVARLRRRLPAAAEADEAAGFFSVLGTRTRLLIVYCLAQAEELCVCDVANALGMNLSTVSHQLRVLRHAGLVSFRPDGKMVFYRLCRPEVGRLVRSELEKATADLV